jgi:hypothetical protein
MAAAAKCMCCDTPLASETEHAFHLCAKHLAEDKDAYGELPPLQAGGEVVYLVQVEESNEDGETRFQYYETGSVVYELDVVRVEIYPGVKARILLSDGKNEDGTSSLTIYCFPWHKVLHWQEG